MSWLRRQREDLLAFNTVLDAVGRDHDMGWYEDEVRLAAIVGSVARTTDFYRDFRPLRRSIRLRQVRRQFDRSDTPPPIHLLRLGAIFFVIDGHHRVAIAKERNWETLPARVHQICTIAYARSCLRHVDLPTSTAERHFLEQLPLPDTVRQTNWLQTPADWSRIADSAMAWGWRSHHSDGTTYCCAADLAAAWWEKEVMPIVTTQRAAEKNVLRTDLPDLQIFVAALAQRDGLGQLAWDDNRSSQAPCR